jgi:hypothetical protein
MFESSFQCHPVLVSIQAWYLYTGHKIGHFQVYMTKTLVRGRWAESQGGIPPTMTMLEASDQTISEIDPGRTGGGSQIDWRADKILCIRQPAPKHGRFGKNHGFCFSRFGKVRETF